MTDPIAIRSFRSVFRLQRRLHRLGNWRVPLPYGLPLAGLGYGLAILLLMLAAARAPVLGAVLGLAPAPLRYALAPILGAAVLLRWRPDGRAPHRALGALLAHRLAPGRIAAFRAAPLRPARLADLSVAPDLLGPRLPAGLLRARGAPVTFVLRYECALSARGRRLRVRPLGREPRHRGTEVTLTPGQRARLG